MQQDYAQAIKWHRKIADDGDAVAQFTSGKLYVTGEGVRQDYAEAAKWYRKAADQGNAFAQTGLGILYENGKGVPQDHAEAAKWFRKAADQGDPVAQTSLGFMHLSGRGVPHLAAAQDYAVAARTRDLTSKEMTAEQVAEAQLRAWEWALKK